MIGKTGQKIAYVSGIVVVVLMVGENQVISLFLRGGGVVTFEMPVHEMAPKF